MLSCSPRPVTQGPGTTHVSKSSSQHGPQRPQKRETRGPTRPGNDKGTAAERPSLGFEGEERPGSGRLPVTTLSKVQAGALFAMQHNGWAHALKVTADGTGLVGHVGAILLRKAADQAGLTAGLSAALHRKGMSPLLDRGIVLVSMAAAIALGATSMSDIAVLAHLAPVLGAAPSGPTVRRALDLAGTPACWTGSPVPARRPGRTRGR